MTTYIQPTLKNRRDTHLVRHVSRNSISILDVMHRLFFEGLSIDMCRKTAKRLTEEGYLAQFRLWDNRSLYRLGQRSISTWSLPRKRGNQLGPQRLPYEVGCLAYTCMDSVIKKRLLPQELLHQCPGFPESLIHQWAYTWERDQLFTIRVEPRCANPRRVVEKLASQLFNYCQNESVAKLWERQQFAFTVVVTSEEQEAVLHQANEQLGEPVRIETSHYPELIRIM